MCTKKDNRSCFNRNRFRDFISIIASAYRLAIYNRSCTCMCRINMACLLNKGGSTYDYSCKKSSKVFARICKINFWNKRLKKTAYSGLLHIKKTKKAFTMLFLFFHLLNILHKRELFLFHRFLI